MPDILTPRCPLCDTEPYMVMGGGTQAFCGNGDGCPVLTWNPTESREHFLRTARQVRLEPGGEESGEGR